MVSPITITLFLICFCCVFILLLLAHARFGEPIDRVKTLWLAPVVVLPIATYFCFFAGVPLSGWTLLACGGSIMVGAVLEGAHIRSARISIDVQHRTLHLEGSSRLVLIVLMLLDAICYTTLLMLMLSVFPALHTSLDVNIFLSPLDQGRSRKNLLDRSCRGKTSSSTRRDR